MNEWEKKFNKRFDFMIPTEFDEVKSFIRTLLAEQEKILDSAYNALKSYQYGNSSPDLAEEICEAIDQAKAKITQGVEG